MALGMDESEELTKLVDAIYKNILDKFNPSARQMISAGKAYLKALHAASSAAKMYIDSIVRLASHAQHGIWGGTADIGNALLQIVEVQKEIQSQQLNILKAFYVDLLVPLESNLEKDTKVVQAEQKKFMQHHKSRQEAYLKAHGLVKKQRKKSRARSSNVEKELKILQALEEEKFKLDEFCEQSLKNAITQERRRYGFVLERQCSLAKHYLVYHGRGSALIEHHLEEWLEVAKNREVLPDTIDEAFPPNRVRVSDDGSTLLSYADDDGLDSVMSSSCSLSLMRKTKSMMDTSCMDLRSLHDSSASSPQLMSKPLMRAKSEFNIASSHQSLAGSEHNGRSSVMDNCMSRPLSLAIPSPMCDQIMDQTSHSNWSAQGTNERRQLVRAKYSYLSSGDNQLSFHEGDLISLIGEKNKGWQYGENLRNRRFGWFPIAYTESLEVSDLDCILDSSIISARDNHHLRTCSMDFNAANLANGSPMGGPGPLSHQKVPLHAGMSLTLSNRSSRPLSMYDGGNHTNMHKMGMGNSGSHLPKFIPRSMSSSFNGCNGGVSPTVGGLVGSLNRAAVRPVPNPPPPPPLPNNLDEEDEDSGLTKGSDGYSNSQNDSDDDNDSTSSTLKRQTKKNRYNTVAMVHSPPHHAHTTCDKHATLSKQNSLEENARRLSKTLSGSPTAANQLTKCPGNCMGGWDQPRNVHSLMRLGGSSNQGAGLLKKQGLVESPSLHSSNDSGFGNDNIIGGGGGGSSTASGSSGSSGGSGQAQPDADYSDGEDSIAPAGYLKENMFATVKLRKTITNDRSAPKIIS